LTTEISFELKIKSGKKTIDKLEGDWSKLEKAINEKYNNFFGGKSK